MADAQPLAVPAAAGPGTLDGARLTGMHFKIWVLSALGVALDGFDFFIIGVALPIITKYFTLESWQVGAIGAAAVLGSVVGASTFGPITDKLGRKAMYVYDLVIFIVFTLLSALAWDAASLIVFRFLLGVGIGADYPISATFVSETMPSRVRGRMVSSTICFQAVGMIGGALVGLAVLAVYPNLEAWRWMLGLGVVPALIISALRATIPESPRWLAAHGRREEAEQAAARLLGPGAVYRSDLGLQPAAGKPHTLRQLLAPALRRRTALATVPWFLMDIATYGVGIFTPVLLTAMAFGHDPTPLGRERAAIAGSAFFDLFLIVGFALAIVLIDRVGRIPLQVIGFAGMAGGLVLLALSVVLHGTVNDHLALVWAGFVIFNVFMNMGPNTTTYVLPAELFPTRLRATGHGLAAAAGKLGAAVGIFFFPIWLADFGEAVTLLSVAGAAMLGLLATWVFRVETTGRSLNEFE